MSAALRQDAKARNAEGITAEALRIEGNQKLQRNALLYRNGKAPISHMVCPRDKDRCLFIPDSRVKNIGGAARDDGHWGLWKRQPGSADSATYYPTHDPSSHEV